MCCLFGYEARGSLVPWLGVEPTPSALEDKDLTTGLPGKSLVFYLKSSW